MEEKDILESVEIERKSDTTQHRYILSTDQEAYITKMLAEMQNKCIAEMSDHDATVLMYACNNVRNEELRNLGLQCIYDHRKEVRQLLLEVSNLDRIYLFSEPQIRAFTFAVNDSDKSENRKLAYESVYRVFRQFFIKWTNDRFPQNMAIIDDAYNDFITYFAMKYMPYFTPEKATITTFLSYYLKQSAIESDMKLHASTLSFYNHKNNLRIYKAYRELSEKLGENPTDRQVYAYINHQSKRHINFAAVKDALQDKDAYEHSYYGIDCDFEIQGDYMCPETKSLQAERRQELVQIVSMLCKEEQQMIMCILDQIDQGNLDFRAQPSKKKILSLYKGTYAPKKKLCEIANIYQRATQNTRRLALKHGLVKKKDVKHPIRVKEEMELHQLEEAIQANSMELFASDFETEELSLA